MRQRRPGFSLIEILITCTLVGLIAMFTVPQFNRTIRRNKVNRAASSVSNDLQVAFTLAQRNRHPVRVAFRTDSLMLVVTNRAQTTTYRRLRLGRGGLELNGPQVTVYPTSGYIEVFPNGLATDSMSITFNAGTGLNLTKRVRMTRAGLVQIL